MCFGTGKSTQNEVRSFSGVACNGTLRIATLYMLRDCVRSNCTQPPAVYAGLSMHAHASSSCIENPAYMGLMLTPMLRCFAWRDL
jgi:hypothetical protein